MLSFSVLISGSPFQSSAHHSALRFIEAVYKQGHTVNCAFFYSEAVQVANDLICPANDEINYHQAWKKLSLQHNFPLYACVSVANKQGVIGKEESMLYELSYTNAKAPFEIVGLGAWAKSINDSDKVIQFQ